MDDKYKALMLPITHMCNFGDARQHWLSDKYRNIIIYRNVWQHYPSNTGVIYIPFIYLLRGGILTYIRFSHDYNN